MNKHALSSATHSTLEHAPRQAARALISMFSLAGLLLLGGCNKGPAPAAPAAEPATTGAARRLRPPPRPRNPLAAPAPAPAAPPPAPVAAAAVAAAPAPPPPPKEYTVPAGTPLVVRIGQTISAKNSNVGDSFSGTLAQSVVVHGVNIFRAGTPVTGTVLASKGAGQVQGSRRPGHSDQQSWQLFGHHQ